MPEYNAIVAVVAIGISGYFSAFLAGIGIDMPDRAASTADEGRRGIINIPAIAVCVLVSWILSRCTKVFGRFELVAVAIKAILILIIIAPGHLLHRHRELLLVHAQRIRSGKKHMPKVIIHSLVIAMLPYVAATLVLTGMQNYRDIDPTAGFASAFNGVGLEAIATIMSVFAVLSILTVVLTFLLGVTRIWFSMSRDGLLPGWFSRTDRHGTPQLVTRIAGIASAFLATDSRNTLPPGEEKP